MNYCEYIVWDLETTGKSPQTAQNLQLPRRSSISSPLQLGSNHKITPSKAGGTSLKNTWNKKLMHHAQKRFKYMHETSTSAGPLGPPGCEEVLHPHDELQTHPHSHELPRGGPLEHKGPTTKYEAKMKAGFEQC